MDLHNDMCSSEHAGSLPFYVVTEFNIEHYS